MWELALDLRNLRHSDSIILISAPTSYIAVRWQDERDIHKVTEQQVTPDRDARISRLQQILDSYQLQI